MRIITGDECGLLKECIPELDEKKAVERVNVGQVIARKHGYLSLCWVEQEKDQSFASLSLDGTCSVWERTSVDAKLFGKYRRRKEIINIFDTKSLHTTNRPLGIYALQDDRLCACNAAGKVSIMQSNKEKVVKTFEVVKLTDQDDPNQALLTACTVLANENRLAVGGRERDVTLFDLDNGKEVWKAKNARPDPQTLLQQQVWPTSISFIQPHILAIGSAHSEIRLYDIRQQRRPIAVTPKGMWEHRITALCPISDSTLIVGDSAGFLQNMDWRQNLQQITGRFVGPAGSIRSIVAHPTEARFSVVGLDRMLRVYDTHTRKQLHCIYLRQRLNCALVGQEASHDLGGLQKTTTTFRTDEADWEHADDQIEDYVDSDNDEPQFDEVEPEFEAEKDMEDAEDENQRDSEGESDEEDEDLADSEDSDEFGIRDDEDSKELDEEGEHAKPKKRVKR